MIYAVKILSKTCLYSQQFVNQESFKKKGKIRDEKCMHG